MGGRRGGLAGRTFLDLGFLHLVVDGLLQVALVAVGEPVDVDLRLALVHCRAFRVVNPVGDVLRPVRGLVAVAMTGRNRCRLLGDIGNWLGGRLLMFRALASEDDRVVPPRGSPEAAAFSAHSTLPSSILPTNLPDPIPRSAVSRTA